MAGRKRSIRFKLLTILLVPVVSLVAIWGFAAALTVSRGLDLLRVNKVFDNVVLPLRTLTGALQEERLLSLAVLGAGGGNADEAGQLQQQRVETNQALAALERQALAADVQEATPALMRWQLNELRDQLKWLSDIRVRVDGRNFTRLQTIEAYSTIIEDAQRVNDKLLIVPDLDVIEQSKAATTLGRAREALSQQAALIAGAVAANRLTGEEHTAFTEMVTQRKLLYGLAFQQFDAELQQPYLELQNTDTYTAFEAVERRMVKNVRINRPLPVEAATWRATTEALILRFDHLSLVTNEKISDRSVPAATTIFMQIGVAAALGVVALVLTVFVSMRFGRRLADELIQLQQTALNLAQERLPRVVARLKRGEDVDTDTETGTLIAGGTKEIDRVGDAFTMVQRTAIEAAVGQAELRKGVGKVFLNLARRNQSLLHRQIQMLDRLEGKVDDPEILEGLFGVDHLTTRMRRHAEGLIILSGAVPARGWRNPVQFFDVVRAAVEEVEDYLRVNVVVPQGPALIGSAVTDVIHLVAELVENATIFSPPKTTVQVRGGTVGRGFVVEVEDRGLGLSREEYEQINQRLADPPEFDLADSDRLGLFVVGRLAARHDIRVSLRPSPYGGTTAIILIPGELVVETGGPEGGKGSRQETDYSVERLVTASAAPEITSASVSGAAKAPPLTAVSVESATSAASASSAASTSSASSASSAAFTSASAAPAASNGGNGAAGLPRRVRQANLAPQLRNTTPLRDASQPRNGQGVRDGQDGDRPHRDVLSSFQAGWRRAGQNGGDAS
ncbi:nitrate- and nitrite sensing domain-containing protein [Thermopolyspora sp. NPDC052614]|uniref:sensor histidine kinase n=1 Tax=Thermopolyspora sp. NPDC052614 TaxID=3155682 RepID=UPI00343E790C